MKLSQFRQYINSVTALDFILPDGTPVPAHFHITDAGLTTRHFIDCGGTVRIEKYAGMQLWVAADTDHRLEPEKLQKIMDMAENLFLLEDPEVEVEYQSGTIGRYGLAFDGHNFLLLAKQTDCLAKEQCGIPQEKTKLKLSELPTTQASCCTPGGGCC